MEITHLVTSKVLAGYPPGTRLIVRRERPHPGAQLDLFDTIEGFRRQVFACDAPVAGGGSIQYLETRHRAHARVAQPLARGRNSTFSYRHQDKSKAAAETVRCGLRRPA